MALNLEAVVAAKIACSCEDEVESHDLLFQPVFPSEVGDVVGATNCNELMLNQDRELVFAPLGLLEAAESFG